MAAAVTSAMSIITSVIQEFFTMLTTFGTEGSVGMGDFFMIGVTIGLCLFAIRGIKSLIWGA